jgi:hypothetical protein
MAVVAFLDHTGRPVMVGEPVWWIHNKTRTLKMSPQAKATWKDKDYQETWTWFVNREDAVRYLNGEYIDDVALEF